ncbi:hypothetical protein RS130_07675 [Paraglaciecola aquimarina]|uniref:ATPase AAA-type core domain-containing protein n=1 Tax=Paraglaciecola aquimarina TaxID=1235557 RepID=A0ABU3SUX9_9ALTE|nr:hypothetical protein [Paraglaciecola aquimarina]MDU0353821.1 hypothetical protein [Paraglaciecola aquimarina]
MSSIDVAFKWAVTLKIIKDLNKNGDLIYSDKLLANDLGTSYKSVNRWIKQTAGNPRLNNYEVKLKDSFGISLNTILQAETIKELVLGLSKDMADNRFDGKKVEFYVNLFAANEMHQTTTNVNTPQQITEKENPPEQQNINHYFLKAPSDSLHLNELSLGDKHAITQYYKGVVSNWVPIQANVPIPSYISSDETYHNYPQKLDLAMQLNLFTQEKLPSLVRIHGPAGSGKTTSALELSHQLSKKGEHCLLRTNEQGNINFDDIAKLCEELVSTQQRLFLFYDSPSQKQYLELGMLITEVIKASIDNLTVVVFDSEKIGVTFSHIKSI